MSKIVKNYRFNYDECKQKFHFEDENVPFFVRDTLDNVCFTSLFRLCSFHVLHLNFYEASFMIVRHLETSPFLFDCRVSFHGVYNN